jgi:hypothetical protein
LESPTSGPKAGVQLAVQNESRKTTRYFFNVLILSNFTGKD